MKKMFNLLLLASPFYALAQTDLTQSLQREKFCLVYVYPVGAKYEVAIDDVATRQGKNKEAMQFDAVDDILNYMARHGWVLSTSASNIIKRGTTSNFVLIYKQLLHN
ncbi:hypothetical protein [Mucilaginibacter polytrichastri]|uniref:DUF4177 domain-containing protein n=1 Tax=Mucilaginibacter polytrichastri TaxID=1302689 RepID=A0A1Q6A1X3_9SPHI|nr:hypothetical protein [Mucilaginibacter polytrichastri]OKS88009.1 hypothetical protein RG47T_3473 [Mucilaginibacter polytrichastri]SFT27065.1 hypothetical protein SAMN04487890_1278 [Mucilaginibacter polytrichastri]